VPSRMTTGSHPVPDNATTSLCGAKLRKRRKKALTTPRWAPDGIE
jgi:hypothetical protein